MKYVLLSLLVLVPAIAFAQSEFVPLTNIPALYETGNSSFSLSVFLNNLYRICIGAAAAIAVFQIMRAGIMYMGGDSVTEKKEAKNLIGLSIAGLILVLSPVVVFSLVNPEILSLEIGRIEELSVDLEERARQETLWTDSERSHEAAKQRCEAQDGTPVYYCRQTDGSASFRQVPYGTSCAANERPETVCRGTEAPSGGACETYPVVAVSNTGICDGGNGFTRIDSSCSVQACGNLPSGSVCCGRSRTTGELYAWKGTYYESSQCALGLTDTPASQCPTQVLRGGTYVTQEQCRQEFESATAGKMVRGSITCSCDFNLGSQSGAFCLTDTP